MAKKVKVNKLPKENSEKKRHRKEAHSLAKVMNILIWTDGQTLPSTLSPCLVVDNKMFLCHLPHIQTFPIICHTLCIRPWLILSTAHGMPTGYEYFNMDGRTDATKCIISLPCG